MTKDEAIKAISDGEIVTHRFFSPEEWMRKHAIGYEFEDGCLCSELEFWSFRDDKSWLDGWSIHESPELLEQ